MARPTSRVSRVLMAGPLAPYAEVYRAELMGRGYTARSAVNELRQVGRLSRWLAAGEMTAAELSVARVEEFLVHQRAEGRHRGSWSRPGLMCMLEVLRDLGVAQAEEPVAISADQRLLARFERYLLVERGLAVGTARGYVDQGCRFLAGLPESGLDAVSAAEVSAAVLVRSAGVSVAATQNFVAGVKSFLRFCFVEGLVERDLSEAALAITGRRRSSLPRGISAQDAKALLASCDRRTSLGVTRHRLRAVGDPVATRTAPIGGRGLPPLERTPDTMALGLEKGVPPWDDSAGGSRRSSSVTQ